MCDILKMAVRPTIAVSHPKALLSLPFWDNHQKANQRTKNPPEVRISRLNQEEPRFKIERGAPKGSPKWNTEKIKANKVTGPTAVNPKFNAFETWESRLPKLALTSINITKVPTANWHKSVKVMSGHSSAKIIFSTSLLPI
jgi:hypothetical protein